MQNQRAEIGWEVHVVDASDIEARLQVRPLIDSQYELVDIEIHGEIAGPYCRGAHTLPAKIALRPAGEGSQVLAESVIPDPCYWTPELPYLYRLSVDCRRGDDVLAEHEQMIGLRRAARLVGPAPK